MLTLRVRDVVHATPRSLIVQLDLAGAVLEYRAGQAVLVGQTGQPVQRPYSLALAPHEARESGTLELLVGLDAEGSPGPHLTGLAAGTPVDVDGPVGTFQLPDHPRERHLLFVAGGTGIAPLRAMMHDALARGQQWAVSMVYSARTGDEFAYGDELRALAKTRRIQLWQTVTREPAEAWTGWRGRIALHHLQEMVQDPETLCFVCGPHALVEDVPRLLQQAGVAPDRIRTEDWGS
jgi:Na+-transporting NADH:ubiquinone oxidoreductase subunit F